MHQLHSDLRILIPAHNEMHRIGPTLERYCEYFGSRAVITVIANACTDDTIPLIERLMQRYANLGLLVINGKVGKGGAIRAGLKMGKEAYVAFVDADGATGPQEADRLLDICREHRAAAVIGSRWLRDSVVYPKQPWRRRAASRVFNSVVRAAFGLPFSDTQCGAKVFCRSALASVLPKLEIANFAFDIDILYRLRREGALILEVPISWSDRAADTKIRLIPSAMSMLAAIVRLRLIESPLVKVPFIDLIARSVAIPVKSRLRLLVLAPDVAATSSPAIDTARAFTEHLRRQGHTVVWISSRSRISDRLRTIFSYFRQWCHDCDAIVEIASECAFMVPALSFKPCILLIAVAPAGSGTSRAYPLLYGRVQRVSIGTDDTPERLAEEVLTVIRQDFPYPMIFEQREDHWSLRVVDATKGVSSLQEL